MIYGHKVSFPKAIFYKNKSHSEGVRPPQNKKVLDFLSHNEYTFIKI